jgi:hypothetical protein
MTHFGLSRVNLMTIGGSASCIEEEMDALGTVVREAKFP